tara:strand:+ start:1752 stop:2297 length:546 start_codon:yes stop_codon:yes gene_type:complete
MKTCAKGGCKTDTKHAKAKKRPGRPCKSGGAGDIGQAVHTEHGTTKRRYGRPCKGDTHKMPDGAIHTGKTHTKDSKVVKKAPAKKGRAVKGAESKTHKGDKDYTTKKGDKDFHEKGHDVKKARKPYKKKAEKEDKQIVDKRLGNVVEQNAGKHKQSPVQRKAKQGVSKPSRFITEVHSAGY